MPLAIVLLPMAMELSPMLATSHTAGDALLTDPARNADLAGYHMMRVPAPDAGILPEPVPRPTKPWAFPRSYDPALFFGTVPAGPVSPVAPLSPVSPLSPFTPCGPAGPRHAGMVLRHASP